MKILRKLSLAIFLLVPVYVCAMEKSSDLNKLVENMSLLEVNSDALKQDEQTFNEQDLITWLNVCREARETWKALSKSSMKHSNSEKTRNTLLKKYWHHFVDAAEELSDILDALKKKSAQSKQYTFEPILNI